MPLSFTFLEEAAAVGLLAAGAAWLLRQIFYVPVPPNKALILFGPRARRTTGSRGADASSLDAPAPRVVIGGGVVLAPWNKAYAYLPLAPIDVEATVRALHSVEGGSGSGWEVTLAVQAKIPAEAGALRAASENLIGLSPAELAAFVRRAVEGSVPLVLARLAVGEVEPDWERLGAEIQVTIGPELIPSGLIVRSVAVRELHRIAQPTVASAGTELRLRPRPARSSSATEEVDDRLARVERGLGVIGAQVDRWLGERSEEPSVPETVLGPAWVPDLPVPERADGRAHDPRDRGGFSRSSRPLRAARASEGIGPADLSENEPAG